MSVFQQRNLIKAFLEKKIKEEKNGGKFSFRQNKGTAPNPIPKLDLGFGCRCTILDTQFKLKAQQFCLFEGK